MEIKKLTKSIHYSLLLMSAAPIVGATPWDIPHLNPVSEQTILFNDNQLDNMLSGELRGGVMVGQSSIIPAIANPDDLQPTIVANRETLVLFKPEQYVAESSLIALTVKNSEGSTIGAYTLNSPSDLPNVAGAIDIGDEVIEAPGYYEYTIKGQGQLNNLIGDRDGQYISNALKQRNNLKIELANGSWLREFHLPKGKDHNNKIITVDTVASAPTKIYFENRSIEVVGQQSLIFKSIDGQWISESEAHFSSINYGAGYWSASLDAEHIKPGVVFEFDVNGKKGALHGLDIGAPTELLLHTIDLGFLTPNRDEYLFQADSEYHRQYYQTLPVSKLIVSEYEPQHFTEVVLPDGTHYTDYSADEGTWHLGDMRQELGMYLIGNGINNANNGLNASIANGVIGHIYPTAQVTAQNSIGKYANGIVIHGGSANRGTAVLDESIGNEWSHELGHTYGLLHFVGGFGGSAHRPADALNSMWGWDKDKQHFIPNFEMLRSYNDTCIDNSNEEGVDHGLEPGESIECQTPFYGYEFGKDAMAGGRPHVPHANIFTLHTPLVLAQMQHFFEGKSIYSDASPTGYLKWHKDSKRYQPWSNQQIQTSYADADSARVDEESLTELFAGSQLVTISLSNGNWVSDVYMPQASNVAIGRTVLFHMTAEYPTHIHMNGTNLVLPNNRKIAFRSNGNTWEYIDNSEVLEARVPEKQGVPVTTLVGFYDPANTLKSYVYPALHGSYGHLFAPSSTVEGCYVNVEFEYGNTQQYQLANSRFKSDTMNRFHINVETALAPIAASVICDNSEMAVREISKPSKVLRYTINGNVQQDADFPPTVTIEKSYEVASGGVAIISAKINASSTVNVDWQMSNELGFEQIDESSIRVFAPEVDIDTMYPIQLKVTDELGQMASASTLLNVVSNVTGECPPPVDDDADKYSPWIAQVYASAKTKVSHDQLVWQNKWYASANEKPGVSSVWELVSDVALLWNETSSYSAGSQVIADGAIWEATQWMNSGQAPGNHAGWAKVADC